METTKTHRQNTETRLLARKRSGSMNCEHVFVSKNFGRYITGSINTRILQRALHEYFRTPLSFEKLHTKLTARKMERRGVVEGSGLPNCINCFNFYPNK